MTDEPSTPEPVQVYSAATERTALAWQRTGLGVVIGYFLLFVASVRHGVIAFGAMAAGLGVTLAVLAVATFPTARRPRRDELDPWVLLLLIAIPVVALAALGALVAVISLVTM